VHHVRKLGFQAQSPDFLRLAEYSDDPSERGILPLLRKTKACVIFSPCVSTVMQASLVGTHDGKRDFSHL
jgi:hypothetical protein